jgi:uncharacterized protein
MPPDETGPSGSADAPAVVHDLTAKRFEIRFAEGVALLQYRDAANGDMVMVHTEVPPALRGRGLADRLAQAALQYARTHRRTVVPLCPFVRGYIDRHPEFQPLVRAAGPSGSGA